MLNRLFCPHGELLGPGTELKIMEVGCCSGRWSELCELNLYESVVFGTIVIKNTVRL